MYSVIFRAFFAALLLCAAPLRAGAAQDEVFLAKMRVIGKIGAESDYEYEVEAEGRGRAILRGTGACFEPGEPVNFFVTEAAPEKGKPVYTIGDGVPRPFREGLAALFFGDG